jgi:hypothetical protein
MHLYIHLSGETRAIMNQTMKGSCSRVAELSLLICFLEGIRNDRPYSLKPCSKYMYRLLQQSVKLHFVFMDII